VSEEILPDEIEHDDSDIPPELRLRPVPEDGIKRRWYALHVHSGQEGNARDMLLAGAQQLENPDQITNILVPMERVAEIRSGEKKVSKRKFFPGYVLIQLPEHPERYADLWQLIKETPGVTGFIGSRTAAVALDDKEVAAVVEVARGERERPKPKVAFDKGQRVKIIDGPFANFLGSVDDVSMESGTVKVMVEIFERLTSIEVEFWQIEVI
jgi:transcriptional antiterminator NusG